MAEGKPKGPTQAQRLIELAQRRYEIVKDLNGKVYAVPKTTLRIALPLQGQGSFSQKLMRDYYERYKTPPNATTLKSAIGILEQETTDGERQSVHLRSARTPDGLVIDLGDATGRAVVITGNGWKIVKSPPTDVIFRRTRLTGALPAPARKGSLDPLRDLANVDDAGWDLVRAWLVLAWMPDIPVPILAITGHQGSGKSVLGRYLVSLVDPSGAPLKKPPKGRDLGEWHTVASGSRVIGLDNVSHINEEFSDALCRAVTGDGNAKRELYSDDELVVQSFKRAVLITSIDPGSMRGDLGERLMPIELGPIEGRRGEKELDRLYNNLRPQLLGGLLSLISKVLANPVTLKRPPRMADAANVMATVDRVLGSGSVSAYQQGQAEVVGTVLESDPLAAAVLAFARRNPDWEGTPTDLYGQLSRTRDLDAPNWPGNTRTMSARLKRMAPALKDAHSLHVSTKRGTERLIRLEWAKPRRKVTRKKGGARG